MHQPDSPQDRADRRKDENIEAWQRRVRIIKEFVSGALTIRNNGDMEEALEKLWQTALQKSTPEGRDEYLQHETEHPIGGAKSQRIADYHLSHDAQILKYLAALRHNLLVEYDFIQKNDLENNLEAVISQLKERGFPIENPEADIVSVSRPDPWNIVVTVTPEWFEKNRPGRHAFRIRRSPLIVMRHGLKERESTERHERIHGLTEGLLPTVHPLAYFTVDVKKIISAVSGKPSEEAEKILQPLLASPEIFNTRKYIDALHGEIISSVSLARFERSPHVRAARRAFMRATDGSGDLADQQKLAEHYGHVFQTAGKHFSDTYEAMQKAIEVTDDPLLRERLLTLQTEFAREFLKMGIFVETAFLTIQEMPTQQREDAHDELVIAMCTLKPSEYYSLPRYAQALADAR